MMMGGNHHHNSNDHLECCRRERIRYAFYQRFREPRLYRYAVNGDWDLIPERCRTHPREAQFVHAYGSKDTALHRLLRASLSMSASMSTSASTLSSKNDLDDDDDTQQEQQQQRRQRRRIEEVKYQAVMALLNAHETAGEKRDVFGRTPLHLACMNVDDDDDERASSSASSSASASSAAAILCGILERNPDAGSMTDVEKRTPLHYLVARNDRVPSDLLRRVIAVHPDALNVSDIAHETPRDIVSSRREEMHDPEEVLSVMTEYHNADETTRNSSSSSSTTTTMTMTMITTMTMTSKEEPEEGKKPSGDTKAGTKEQQRQPPSPLLSPPPRVFPTPTSSLRRGIQT